jgi:tRNA G18 (ribose-2'-O)-methylase SpoU
MVSGVESLNVAVATGVLLYEVGLRRAAATR